MNVITISRQSGSRGDEVVDLLAQKTGMQLVDKQSIENTLIRHGVPARSVERFDEKKPGFWEIISSDRDRYYHYLKASILETAGKGDQIIVGRGAPVFLADIPGILHLRIVSPLPKRIQRVMDLHS